MRKLLALCVLVLFTACATSPTGRNQLMLVSPEMAIAASKNAYAQTLVPLKQQGKLDADPRASKRVRYIAGRIIAQTRHFFPQTADWQWDIRVIDQPETINAWCMAGGKMAVYSGLLNKIHPTDDELAQVIGHEIAHAVANHTAEKMSIVLASQLGITTVAAVSGESKGGRAALAASALAAQLAVQLPNSRQAESEADRIGIELAAKAGYDPYAAISLWQKMAQTGNSPGIEFLSTHPTPANRMAQLRRLAPEMMPYYLNKAERPVYRFTAALPEGAAKRQ